MGRGAAGRTAAREGVMNLTSLEHVELEATEKVSILGKPSRNMLCCRAVDSCGRVVAVIQAINRRGGAFSSADAQLLAALAPQVGAAVAEAARAQELETGRRRFMALSRMAVECMGCSSEALLWCRQTAHRSWLTSARSELVLSWGPRVTGASTCKLWTYDCESGELTSSSIAHGRQSLSVDEHSASAMGIAARSRSC
eukprot:767566-Hanusia_phi.AAC.5